MSENPDRPPGDDDLEALLGRLVPTPLDVDYAAELWNDRERTEVELRCDPLHMQWGRVVPLTLLCTVVTFVFALYQYGDRLAKSAAAPAAGLASADSLSDAATPTSPGQSPSESPSAPDSSPNAPHFLPVSSHGTLVRTSSGGVIQTDEGPRERLRIDYRDAYHWHDPDSGTNLRYFEPRSEEVVVPLRTD